MQPIDEVTLYYKDARSDNVYTITLTEKDGQFEVAFAYGPRGGTMQHGVKCAKPDETEARTHFNTLRKSKEAKGYRAGAAAGKTVEGEAPPERVRTDVLPMLLSEAEDARLPELLDSPNWMMQEKLDGNHWLLFKQGANVTSQSLGRGGREGKVNTILPESIVSAAFSIGGDFILDGEVIGDVFHAFDILRYGKRDFTTEVQAARYGYLAGLLDKSGDGIQQVFGTSNPIEKRPYAFTYQEIGHEGLVFKRIDQPYRPGKTDAALKFKFWLTCSVIVDRLNEKKSAAVKLFDGTQLGDVSILGKGDIKPGDVVEIRYLYRHDVGGKLIQPVLMGVRDYIDPADCTEEKNRLRVKGKPRA
ncbi:MAG: hypothetical protein NVS1B6_00090 [Steroidobacteraceae bacterium]